MMWVLIISLHLLAVSATQETFDEELLIKDVGSGYSAFHFNFVSKRPDYVTPQPWSPKSMLGSSLQRTCDPAQSSRVYILHSPNNLSWTPTGLPQSYQSSNGQYLSVYDSVILLNGVFDSLRFSTVVQNVRLPQLISVSKFITGCGSISGGVRSLITSKADFPVTLVFLDAAQWFTQVLFSTLELELFNSDQNKWDSIQPVKYALQPSLVRERMSTIELVVILPPHRQLAISYKFRKILQRVSEFPPDANHGYSLPSASVSYLLTEDQMKTDKTINTKLSNVLTLPSWASTYADYFNAVRVVGSHAHLVRIYSTIVLVTLPTPDFSMPFNVLCFVCSVVAVMIGAVNTATALQLTAKIPAESKLARIRKVLRRLSEFRFVPREVGSHEKKE